MGLEGREITERLLAHCRDPYFVGFLLGGKFMEGGGDKDELMENIMSRSKDD